MKHLAALNKYFWKYRVRLLAGIFFVVLSNYFTVMAPEVTGYVVSQVQQYISGQPGKTTENYSASVLALINWLRDFSFSKIVLISSIVILLLALLRGIFMFLMRQTLIVMSRYIEYDLKNAIYNHYQQLDMGFFKTHSTGDMMNRIAEDVSRVRMYCGPAVMYTVNLLALITLCLVNMLRKDFHLTLVVVAPLPLLAITIYFVNTIIHKKSERVQALLSDLTTNAQESYSGIRVIKSFVQEKAMLGFFSKNSEAYRKNAVSLAKVEAIYFPSMTLLVGLSTLLTILIGSKMALTNPDKVGIIVEFVIYINMLMFPVSAIGSVASMVQRAAASQKRINEFLDTKPLVTDPVKNNAGETFSGSIVFKNVTFTYPHTGIRALHNFSLKVKPGEKVMILGKTGSGKSTLAQLLLRFYDPDEGEIFIGDKNIRNASLPALRNYISYVPQDVFLFSDTVDNNIRFGLRNNNNDIDVGKYAEYAAVNNEILSLDKGYETMVGERGVTLSGGQKQRVSIARALLKESPVMLFDDCLSAVDAKTEHKIVSNLNSFLQNKTTIIITHRIFLSIKFDKIIILSNGEIAEAGTHAELLAKDGYYAELYNLQLSEEKAPV
ncbi:ABC transporter ATP-binding protein [Parafilimonas terrae]|uniref:ATP-binding cassette, subfamily B n=1 Tax=Parafilimonas terrae TaxID=1465490 RepID=A0A1I5XDX2_9BACT|nr:ABC transporter ATP-binding protein [Parafilimonas terrae]SFQ30160.1 ATP-binding cassette, subfamily B [Parafilimonas terrae]